MKKSVQVSLKYIILSLFLTSCKPSAILSESTCTPPCWNGIKPGISTELQVFSILSKSKEIDKEDIYDHTDENIPRIIWKFNSSVSDGVGEVNFQNGVVAKIEIVPKQDRVTLEEVQNKYGEPEQIFAYSYGNRLVVFTIDPINGIIVAHVKEWIIGGEKVEIMPNDTVDVFYLFDPNIIDEIFTSGIIAGIEPAFVERGIKPWNGFGPIDYIIYR